VSGQLYITFPSRQDYRKLACISMSLRVVSQFQRTTQYRYRMMSFTSVTLFGQTSPSSGYWYVPLWCTVCCSFVVNTSVIYIYTSIYLQNSHTNIGLYHPWHSDHDRTCTVHEKITSPITSLLYSLMPAGAYNQSLCHRSTWRSLLHRFTPVNHLSAPFPYIPLDAVIVSRLRNEVST